MQVSLVSHAMTEAKHRIKSNHEKHLEVSMHTIHACNPNHVTSHPHAISAYIGLDLIPQVKLQSYTLL